MPTPERTCGAAACRVAVNVATSLTLLAFLVSFSLLGGFLNHSRGGYVDLRSGKSHNDALDYNLHYWPDEVTKNLLFALPTGLVVLIFSLHFRGSFTVFLMTWFSLYIGWGSYMNVGSVWTDYGSRSGVFDWMVGRQENQNWTFHRRFVREYSAMSLRGLAWTGPQGYALQQLGFGWEYSLSGAMMGFVYYLGSKTPTTITNRHLQRLFGAHTAYAEYYWGTWLWFVLIVACLSQLVRRMRIWVSSKNSASDRRHPFSTWERVKYESLNHLTLRYFYEGFMILFNLVCMCSLVYYSLVFQEDVRNKGMTFFGLFTDTVFLTFLQGWSLSLLYLRLRYKLCINKHPSKPREIVPTGEPGGVMTYSSPRASPRIPDLDNFEIAAATAKNENKPLLGWFGGGGGGSNSPTSPTSYHRGAASDGEAKERYRSHLHAGTAEPTQNATALRLLSLWACLEKWVWMDVFILLRRVIGFITLLATIHIVVLCVIALIWNWETPRYLPHNCTYEYHGV